jgi:hypothetical protein
MTGSGEAISDLIADLAESFKERFYFEIETPSYFQKLVKDSPVIGLNITKDLTTLVLTTLYRVVYLVNLGFWMRQVRYRRLALGLKGIC